MAIFCTSRQASTGPSSGKETRTWLHPAPVIFTRLRKINCSEYSPGRTMISWPSTSGSNSLIAARMLVKSPVPDGSTISLTFVAQPPANRRSKSKIAGQTNRCLMADSPCSRTLSIHRNPSPSKLPLTRLVFSLAGPSRRFVNRVDSPLHEAPLAFTRTYSVHTSIGWALSGIQGAQYSTKTDFLQPLAATFSSIE